MAELLAVCRVHVLHPDAGTVGVTAIDKRPVDGRVKVRPFGLYADVQADRANHGGPDQAVYAYAQEDADFWSAELGREVTPGLFGENLRVRGLDVNRAVVGERWQIGSALLEVTQPRVPCQTFGRRLGEQRWVRRFTQANRTGAYLRVIENGEIGAGDTVDVVQMPVHGVTVADWFAARYGVTGSEGIAVAADEKGAAAPDALEKLARRLLDAHALGEIRLSADMLRRSTQAASRIPVD
ncbi:MOSC domain-containing protein [Promicromonospora iranensis]|uniref:MOSC domain-containing protein YiiM n=1 Tax=Promicromonospora iranensis TaxID=1105144 RepID=A0ABU2CQ10_9MICO|nr:MOSC domain-containing protein [Promicromonospora iranensis]MDR7383433.1 MOSC domain-containing protein YiiM [Promicromonospora iranensis]